jgi:hypothetical protein
MQHSSSKARQPPFRMLIAMTAVVSSASVLYKPLFKALPAQRPGTVSVSRWPYLPADDLVLRLAMPQPAPDPVMFRL